MFEFDPIFLFFSFFCFVCVSNSRSDIGNTLSDSTLIIISLIFGVVIIVIALICAVNRKCTCHCGEKPKEEMEFATINNNAASVPSVNKVSSVSSVNSVSIVEKKPDFLVMSYNDGLNCQNVQISDDDMDIEDLYYDHKPKKTGSSLCRNDNYDNNRRGGAAGKTADIVMDESNYQQWSQNDVLIWIKMHLAMDGIDDTQIQMFINEFEKQYITGATLARLKNDSNELTSLKSQMDRKAASFGVWLVVKTAIQNLGQGFEMEGL